MITCGLTDREIKALEDFICDNRIKEECYAYKNGDEVIIEKDDSELRIPIDMLLDSASAKYSVVDLERIVRKNRNVIFFDDILENGNKCVYFNIDKSRDTDELKRAIDDLEKIVNSIKMMDKIKKELARINIRIETIIEVDSGRYYKDYISISVSGLYIRGRGISGLNDIESVKDFLENALSEMKTEISNREKLEIEDKDIIEILDKFYKE